MVDVYSSIKILFIVGKLFGTASFRISGRVNSRKLICNKYDKFLLTTQCVLFSVVVLNMIKELVLNAVNIYKSVPVYITILSYIIKLILNVSSGFINRYAVFEVIMKLEYLCDKLSTKQHIQIKNKFIYLLFVTQLTFIFSLTFVNFQLDPRDDMLGVFYLITMLVSASEVIKFFALILITKQINIITNKLLIDESFMKDIFEIHLELYDIYKKINKIINFSIVIFFTGFDSLTTCLYYCIFDNIGYNLETLLTSFMIWISMNITEVILIVYFCHSTENEVFTYFKKEIIVLILFL